MSLDSKQHVREVPEHVRANSFALETSGEAEHEILVDRYGEVVRPEIRETFDEWTIGSDALTESGGSFGNIDRPIDLTNLHDGSDGVRLVIRIRRSLSGV